MWEGTAESVRKIRQLQVSGDLESSRGCGCRLESVQGWDLFMEADRRSAVHAGGTPALHKKTGAGLPARSFSYLCYFIIRDCLAECHYRCQFESMFVSDLTDFFYLINIYLPTESVTFFPIIQSK